MATDFDYIADLPDINAALRIGKSFQRKTAFHDRRALRATGMTKAVLADNLLMVLGSADMGDAHPYVAGWMERRMDAWLAMADYDRYGIRRPDIALSVASDYAADAKGYMWVGHGLYLDASTATALATQPEDPDRLAIAAMVVDCRGTPRLIFRVDAGLTGTLKIVGSGMDVEIGEAREGEVVTIEQRILDIYSNFNADA